MDEITRLVFPEVVVISVEMLSILVPTFNESRTLGEALKQLLDVNLPCSFEIIVVDDGSSDGTPEIVSQVDDPRLRFTRHPINRGKGAAVRTGLAEASGDYAVVFDADLEYYAGDLPRLLEPILAGDAELVYGTRSFGSHTAYSFWFVMGNKVVTMFANVLFNSWISDLETCFKLMPVKVFQALDLRSAGFGMEAETTAKLLRAGFRPFEVPIQYKARSRVEGKKLTWHDGVDALWILGKVRLGLMPDRLARLSKRVRA